MQTRWILMMAVGTCMALRGKAEPEKGQDAGQIALIQADLVVLEKRIDDAQKNVNEYMSLHDIRRCEIIDKSEQEFIDGITAERVKAGTRLLLLKMKHPFLVDTNVVAAMPEADAVRAEYAQAQHDLVTLDAIEYRWAARQLQSTMAESEVKRLQDRATRLKAAYSRLADRLHELTMRQELKSLRSGRASDPPLTGAEQMAMVEADLVLIEEQIENAQQDVMEYDRLNDIRRQRITAATEREFLDGVITERAQSVQKLFALQAKYPFLAGTNVVASMPEADALRTEQDELKGNVDALEKIESRFARRPASNRDRQETALERLQDRVVRLQATDAQLAGRLDELTLMQDLKSLQDDAPTAEPTERLQ